MSPSSDAPTDPPAGAPDATPDWHAPALELADTLRELAAALVEREPDTAVLARAADHARRAREALAGSPRALRWYDAGGGVPDPAGAAHRAYLGQSPIRGVLNPGAPPLETCFAARPDGTPVVVGRARLGIAYEGPPHGVHGGWVAALFDEVLGNVQGLVDARGVTASLTVHYRQVTPLDEDLRFEAWIHERSGRRVLARATCHAGPVLTAEAEALFLTVDFREIQGRMRSRRAG